MKIQEINSKKISFKRQLTPKELNQYQATLKEAKEKTGNNGKSVLIVHDACLPQSVKTNTGVGNLNTSEAQNFFKFMKSYLNINAIEVLPSGELSPLADGKFFCAYSSSALSLSPHQINLLALTKPEYGSILKQEEFDEVVKANILQDKAKTVNYENVVTEESSFNQALKQAFKRFLTMKETSPLKKEFEQYKAKLQEMSAEFNAILQLSTDVATKQYDMEIDIYKNIWSTLHELSLCQKCIYNFQNPTQADPEEYLLLLKNSRSDFKIKLENFQAQIDSAAPFYQGEAYNLLCELDKKYTELFNIIDSSVSLAGMTSENKERINTQIIPRIEEIKGNLTKIIRDYLFSLKKMPDIPI